MSKHVGSDSIGGIPQKCGIKSVPVLLHSIEGRFDQVCRFYRGGCTARFIPIIGEYGVMT